MPMNSTLALSTTTPRQVFANTNCALALHGATLEWRSASDVGSREKKKETTAKRDDAKERDEESRRRREKRRRKNKETTRKTDVSLVNVAGFMLTEPPFR